jgi:hypothetical protein
MDFSAGHGPIPKFVCLIVLVRLPYNVLACPAKAIPAGMRCFHARLRHGSTKRFAGKNMNPVRFAVDTDRAVSAVARSVWPKLASVTRHAQIGFQKRLRLAAASALPPRRPRWLVSCLHFVALQKSKMALTQTLAAVLGLYAAVPSA